MPAVETLGAFGREIKAFIQDLGQRLITTTLDRMSRAFLLQKIAVAIQRENAASVLGPCNASDLCVCD
jgi:hypothetical protein